MANPSASPKLQQACEVHKFGGSSLQDSKHIDQVVQTIIQQVKSGDYVVVSANGPVTDWLLAWVSGHQQAQQHLWGYLKQLIPSVLEQPDELLSQVKEDLIRIKKWLHKPALNENRLMALGELWSAQLLTAKLTEQKINCHWLDARDFLQVDDQGHWHDVNRSAAKLQKSNDLGSGQGIHVVTGFIARNLSGDSVTLGRNGSDYSATLLAHILKASAVTLWTDVDGVYTADPNVIKQAFRIDELTLAEAQALSELGSQVLHQKTMAPLLDQQIKMVINTCQSATAGTRIIRQPIVAEPQVKTLAHKSQLVRLKLNDLNELLYRQLQSDLIKNQINHYAAHFDKTQNELLLYIESADWFKVTQLIKNKQLNLAEHTSGISMISAVGHDIRQSTAIIAAFLNHASRFSGTSFHFPANDHTLCVLVPDEQAEKLLLQLHQTFFELAPSIPIVVLGHGNIGQQFLRILKQHKPAIERNIGQSLSVVAVANSRFYQFSSDCLLSQPIELLEPNDEGQLIQKLAKYQGQAAVIIDLTASEVVAAQYHHYAEQGWHIISANKVAAADRSYAQQVHETLDQSNRLWLKNTTVGAALPVQSSIKNMQDSGDQVRSVGGVFSGSLSWLFGQYEGQKPFMEWVKQAHEQAYTEPDPREDLSGQDVYRKALILAQELGFEPQQVHFEPVLPEQFLQGKLADFWEQQDAINDHIQRVWQAAKQQAKVLRYVAQVHADELRVELKAVDSDHPTANLKPGDNIFIIESDWYAGNPLVIQGPGAGREVTAAGVLNDLLEVLQSS